MGEIKDQVDKFTESVQSHLNDFESIDLRIVAFKLPHDLIALGGRATLMDFPSDKIELFPDLFDTQQIVILQDRLPLNKLDDLRDKVINGEIPVGNKVVHLMNKLASGGLTRAYTIRFNELPGYLSDGTPSWHGFYLTNESLPANELLSYDVVQKLQRTLSNAGRGYKDLPDLFNAFILGHSGEADRAIHFDIVVPIRIVSQLQHTTQLMKIRIDTGRRIDRAQLKFTTILRPYQKKWPEDRKEFKFKENEWEETNSGYVALGEIPVAKEQECELLVTYRGEKVENKSVSKISSLELFSKISDAMFKEKPESGKIFIVHGKNHAVRDNIDLYLTKELGLQTQVMEAGANKGRTLPEKFEEMASQCAFAIFVLTADDDLTISGGKKKKVKRPRQNVLIETGYFWGALGRRDKVAFLVEEHPLMDLPSDIKGLTYIPITNDLARTKSDLRKELGDAGLLEKT